MAASLRVLCLHGFRTNRHVLRDQLRDLQGLLGPAAEFVIPDGPLEAEGLAEAPVELAYGDQRPFYEWWRQRLPNGEDINDPLEAAALILEAAEQDRSDLISFDGLEQSIALLNNVIQERGPFDVLLGFSQGATMATILSMWHWKYRQQIPWQLNLCFNGNQYGLSSLEWFQRAEDRLQIPSVHVLSPKDPLYPEGRRLAHWYNDPVRLVMEHDRGHRLPSVQRHPQLYQAILDAVELHCGFVSPSQTSARL